MNQPEIIDTDTITDSHNRAHQRGNQHGTDNDSCRVDIQADRRDQNGTHQCPQIGAVQFESFADVSVDFPVIGLVHAQTEACNQCLLYTVWQVARIGSDIVHFLLSLMYRK